MKVYVVTAPESIRGVYETWADCKAAVSGARGARYQAVSSRAQAEAMLSGAGIELPAGTYAFVDGNHLGGVGVVLVRRERGGDGSLQELGMTVHEVFRAAGLPGLESPARITAALARLRNILAELGALYLALRRSAPGSTLTVVHDYEGVGAWMEGRWKTKDSIVTEVVDACRTLVVTRGLTVAFRHQRGHESTFAARNDFAAYNTRADRLAAEAAVRL